jgi:hypothetical protein
MFLSMWVVISVSTLTHTYKRLTLSLYEVNLLFVQVLKCVRKYPGQGISVDATDTRIKICIDTNSGLCGIYRHPLRFQGNLMNMLIIQNGIYIKLVKVDNWASRLALRGFVHV